MKLIIENEEDEQKLAIWIHSLNRMFGKSTYFDHDDEHPIYDLCEFLESFQ